MWNTEVEYTRIKLCEFESLDAAYEASGLGVDALGFHIFRKQDVAEKCGRFASIFRLLPGGIDKTLLTDLDFDDLLRVLDALPVDAIQLYPDWQPDVVAAFRRRAPGVRILKVMSARPEENAYPDATFLGQYEPVVDAILLDSHRIGGTGQTSDWDHCASIVEQSKRPVFLAGGLTPENVGRAIRQVAPFGVDVETGVSDRIPNGPLVKNLKKCRDFVAAVAMTDRECIRARAGDRAAARGDA